MNARLPEYHLLRTPYRTDVNPDEPDYIGTSSSTIPGRALDWPIVDVDWTSEHGIVWVTYLVPGPGQES